MTDKIIIRCDKFSVQKLFTKQRWELLHTTNTFITTEQRVRSSLAGWLVGFYGMSTLVGLFYTEDIVLFILDGYSIFFFLKTYFFNFLFICWLVGCLLGIYGMSTLVGLFNAEDIFFLQFLMGIENAFFQTQFFKLIFSV